MEIMVCFDSSSVSRAVLKEAQKHAGQWNADIRVVKAVTRIEPMKHEKVVKLEEQLEAEIKALFEGSGIPYTVQLHVDDVDAGKKIVNIAERNRVDLIFLGIRKRSKVGKLLFGSTTQYVILNAPCPVLTLSASSLL